ncbi:hypothetical protein GCM10007036_44140 [Alsobacter metallidurans]|uniref:HTH HARE-type domain-containing protein n=1 Tax=Alsobacter metallidurans TaxID=340221 RepID=A0A917MKE6_9HYPH|nr:hypothetical protein [Alsobacter metallidurans]GGH32337.1 hypothetical protein GCM10007036_44140 [Alsobacter metallidurans]
MTDQSYTRALSDLAVGLRSKLMNSSEEFRLLASLEKLIEEMSSQTGGEPAPGRARTVAPPAPQSSQSLSSKSLRTSAYEILREANGPLPIGEILERLNQRGVTFSARNPRAALSSNMSQDARFENGVVGGRPMWRLKETAQDEAAEDLGAAQRVARR